MSTRTRRRSRGYILVEALVLIAVLVALLVVLVADQRTTLQETQNRLRQRRAEVAARSALARALSVLETANPSVVTLSDDWAVLGDNGNQSFDLGNGVTFRMQILDAGSRLNINTATEQQLNNLPLTQEQISSLLDWREAGTSPRPNGAKTEYYNGLATPYNARLGPLSSVDELLLIKDWTARGLYTPVTDVTPQSGAAVPLEDAAGNPLALASVLTVDSGSPNNRADGSARLNLAQGNVNAATLQQLGINATVAGQIAARGPYASFQTLLSIGGLDTNTTQVLLDGVRFTAVARSTGKIDVNTASEAVLRTLPNMTQDVASAIVSRQETGGFASLGDLATIPGLSGGTLLPQIADLVTVGSDTWIVRAYGESGGVGTAIEAVVGLRNNRAIVQTWHRWSSSGVPAWWQWEAETNTTVEAGASL